MQHIQINALTKYIVYIRMNAEVLFLPTVRNRETTATQRESDYKRSGSTHHDLIDWWVGTVVLAFFPSILSAIFSLSRNATLDLNRIIGDGELILTSFLITAPSLIIEVSGDLNSFCSKNGAEDL